MHDVGKYGITPRVAATGAIPNVLSAVQESGGQASIGGPSRSTISSMSWHLFGIARELLPPSRVTDGKKNPSQSWT